MRKTSPWCRRPAAPLWALPSPRVAGRRPRLETLTLSNISKSLALGWWMVQMTVRPPWASDFMRDTTWKQEALSRPLSRERPRGGEACELGGAWRRDCLGWDSYHTGDGAGRKGQPRHPVHTMIQTSGGTKKPNVTSIY